MLRKPYLENKASSLSVPWIFISPLIMWSCRNRRCLDQDCLIPGFWVSPVLGDRRFPPKMVWKLKWEEVPTFSSLSFLPEQQARNVTNQSISPGQETLSSGLCSDSSFHIFSIYNQWPHFSTTGGKQKIFSVLQIWDTARIPVICDWPSDCHSQFILQPKLFSHLLKWNSFQHLFPAVLLWGQGDSFFPPTQQHCYFPQKPTPPT